MNRKEQTETGGLRLMRLEYYPEQVGHWTPINNGGVIGHFENFQRKTIVVRCESQIESVGIPTQDQVADYTRKGAAFQKNINTEYASG